VETLTKGGTVPRRRIGCPQLMGRDTPSPGDHMAQRVCERFRGDTGMHNGGGPRRQSALALLIAVSMLFVTPAARGGEAQLQFTSPVQDQLSLVGAIDVALAVADDVDADSLVLELDGVEVDGALTFGSGMVHGRIAAVPVGSHTLRAAATTSVDGMKEIFTAGGTQRSQRYRINPLRPLRSSAVNKVRSASPARQPRYEPARRLPAAPRRRARPARLPAREIPARRRRSPPGR
jgi:hypothetical protein